MKYLKFYILVLHKYLLLILKCLDLNANSLAKLISSTPNTIRTFMSNPLRAIMPIQTFVSIMSVLEYSLKDKNRKEYQRRNLRMLMNAIFIPENYDNYSFLLDNYIEKMRASTTRVLTHTTDKLLGDEDFVEVEISEKNTIPIKSILCGRNTTWKVSKNLIPAFNTGDFDNFSSAPNNMQFYYHARGIEKNYYDLEIEKYTHLLKTTPECEHKGIIEYIKHIEEEKKWAEEMEAKLPKFEVPQYIKQQEDWENKINELSNPSLLYQDGLPKWISYVFDSNSNSDTIYKELKDHFLILHKGDEQELNKQIESLLKELKI